MAGETYNRPGTVFRSSGFIRTTLGGDCWDAGSKWELIEILDKYITKCLESCKLNRITA